MKTKLTPRQAKTFDEICGLRRDNVGTDTNWMIFDEIEVTITKQTLGGSKIGRVTIPRADFEAFIDWYNTGTFRKPRKKEKR